MALVEVGIGLVFWMTLSFGVVLFILAKYAWPAILKGLKEREQSIEDALHAADKARDEMKNLKAENEELLAQAKEERDAILKDARKVRESIIEESRTRANEEATRIVDNAIANIENEKMAAIVDLKNQIANLSIEIAEKVLMQELADKDKQQAYIKKLVDDVNFN